MKPTRLENIPEMEKLGVERASQNSENICSDGWSLNQVAGLEEADPPGYLGKERMAPGRGDGPRQRAAEWGGFSKTMAFSLTSLLASRAQEGNR